MQQTYQTPGPLTTPKAFRRPIGAHAILVSLLLADLCGLLFWLFAGALLTPLLWWIVQGILPMLHVSLLLDVGIVLILWSSAHSIFGQLVLKKKAEVAWKDTGPLIMVIIVILLLIALLNTSWMAIPAPVPAITPQPIHGWPLQLSIIGGEVATGLTVLAHLALWRRDHRKTADKLLSFSRAHPGGTLCRLIEHYYDIYRRGLARFVHPPLQRLKTPPTYFFYPRTLAEADARAHPERECYWEGGELVICQAYLSPEGEQAEILLPLVARLLHDYNSPVTQVERLFRLAHLAEDSLWGTFIWLPTAVAFSCERHWQAMERDRVLDRDRFAWKCGEGKRLRKLLRRQLGDLHKTDQPDNTVPTLAERIDHLDSLLRTEAHQLKELRATLPPVPPAPPTTSLPKN